MSSKITATDLYKSILYRAADIYEIDYEDVERDVGQQFDPIVRFMSGALASELERVYAHLDDVESRIQKRLAKVLLPEYFHLPQPAHALATATASGESFVIGETTQFEVESEDDEKHGKAFTPVLQSRILPVNMKLIATENQILDGTNRPKLRRGKFSAEVEEVRKIAIGFESKEAITNWAGVSIYFNLRGGGDDESQKSLFFDAVPNCSCYFQGNKLDVKRGLPKGELILEDYLNGNERMQKIIRSRYEHHFITFTTSEVPEMAPELAQEFLPKWFAKSLSEEETQARTAKISPDLDKPMYWLEITLSKPVEISQVDARLSIKFNVFPVVNRRLHGHHHNDHEYLRNNSIKWISLKPKEDFLSMRRVYEVKPPEYPVYTFKPFADFKEEQQPSYTLRHGGIGRWDDFNAWQRLAYVVDILQENYQHNELINEAAASLSLEDIHHLLGRKISKTAREEKPTKDIYVLLHAGISSRLRTAIEYWTSVGEEANGIPFKSKLNCTSKHKSRLDGDSIALVTSSRDGKKPLNSVEQLNAMKSALLSRGRIVTREDVKVFCKSFLNDKLEDVIVKDGVGVDPRFDFGMTRVLEVSLVPSKSARKDDWEGICRQVQTLLQQQSTSSIPIKVQAQNPNILSS